MDEWIDEILQILQDMLENGEEISDEILDAIADALEEENAEEQPIQVPYSEDAELLWHLSNSNPEAFISYLRSVPDPALNNLLQNPTQLQGMIETLSQQYPPDQPQAIDGVEKAPINSSNIYGFRYDPRSRRLMVRFQGGPMYEYENVPPHIYSVFSKGAIPAKTNGQNQFGKWWIGKNPSLGAAFYELIRSGPYPYERVA